MSQQIGYETETEELRHDRMSHPGQDQETDDEPGIDDDYEPAPIPFPLIVMLEAALAPLALILGFLLGQHPLSQFSWTSEALTHGFLASLPMLALLGLTLSLPLGPFRRIRAFFEEELRPALAEARWYDLALLSISAGLGEEMLFRGVLQGASVAWFGPIAGLIAASLLFGLLHPVSPAYVLLATTLGGYLGFVLLYEGNLLTVALAHAIYDFVAMSLLTRQGRDEEPAPED